MSKHHPRIVAAASLTAAALTPAVLADISSLGDGIGNEYLIQTTGATALKAFSSADGNRGTYLLGLPTLTIGDTVYNLSGGFAQGIGQQVNGAPSIIEPPSTADRIVYGYHETGSGNGINDLAIRNGLLSGSPATISSSNPHFVMGEEFVNFPTSGLTNQYDAFYNNTANEKAVPGVTNAFYDYTTNSKPLPQIAYSDVSFEQFFALSGNESFDARPTTAGYGLGQDATQYNNRRFTTNGENYQDLRSADALDGGVTPGTTKLRNTPVAAVPFTISANPGTGLDSISESDARFLQAVGRLENGVNFNSVTRDSGSGTRNQGSNNLVLDPSFGQGERDRVQLIDANGDAIGAEANPRRDRLNGGSQPNTVEYGPSAIATFADKRSGSSALRPTVQGQRMALGVLSVGDVGSRANSTTESRPVRVLAIDFEGDDFVGADLGAVQPTADNVTSGRYQLWSAAQAITVSGTLATGADANGQLSGGVSEATSTNGLIRNLDGTVGTGTILNDVDDDGTGTGIVKKFLLNITSEASLADFTAPDPNKLTPLDTIISAGFIPLPLMDVTKEFDGDTQITDTRSAAADAVYAGSAGAELRSNLSFTRAGDYNGADATSQRYRIYDVANTSDIKDNPLGNIEIGFTDRTFLAGDLNGDQVRDLDDVEAWAEAIGDTDGFLAANTDIDASSLNVTTAPGGELDASELDSTQKAGLLALTDLNGDGNVQVVGPNGVIAYTPENYAEYGLNAGVAGGTDKVVAISREDARFFLYGSTVDTSDFATAQEKRELGVRLGQLKKNEAITRFNATLDQLVVDGRISQADADAQKFDPFDVNFDDVSDLSDAQAVNRNIGRSYTSLADSIASGDDLVAVELTDDADITFVSSDGPADGDLSDFERIHDALVASMDFVQGDYTLDGTVDLSDFTALRNNFGGTSAGIGYGSGDSDFDNDVDLGDFTILRNNFGLSVGMAAAAAVVDEALDLNLIVNWDTGEISLKGEGDISGVQLLSADGDLLAGLGDTLGMSVLSDASDNFAIGMIEGFVSIDGELSLGELLTRFGGGDLNVQVATAGGNLYTPSMILVPEPTLAMAGFAAGSLLLRRRRA
jgi:hypothetical protein